MSARATLLAALLGPAIGYFALIAWLPGWLAQPWQHGSPLTWSVMLALALLWYGFLITLLYTLWHNRAPC